MAPRKLEPKLCACGCGGMTKGGDYLQGHDQRLRTAIENAVGGLLNLRSIVEQYTGKTIIVSSPDQSNNKRITHPEPKSVDMSIATDDAQISWNIAINPKRVDSKAWHRFEAYFNSKTVSEYLDNGGTKADLKYDWERSFFDIRKPVDMTLATDHAKILWKVAHNPKQKNSQAWSRFEHYIGSGTVSEYLKRGGSKADLKYDWEHNFIAIIGE